MKNSPAAKRLYLSVTLLLSILFTTFNIVQAQTNPQANNDIAAKLIGHSLGSTPLMDDVKELCDQIGGRPTGSPACQRAVKWSVDKFKQFSIPVTTEKYNMPNLWLAESAEASCLSPEKFNLRVVALPGSASTPNNSAIEAELVDAGSGTPEEFAKLGARAKGAIALIRQHEMKTLEDLFNEYIRNRPLTEAAQKAGVVALLIQSTRPNGLLYSHPINPVNTIVPFPALMVSREQANKLARLTEHSSVKLKLLSANKIEGSVEAENVVAEIKGSEKPDEIILLGAHLDSWALGTGAEDNGINAALVIDVARTIKRLGLTPRRTIRFVLFTGEEQGLLGSKGYVLKHAAEMDKHIVAIIYDIGSGRTNGFFLSGREELRKPLEEALAPLQGLNVNNHPLDGIDGTDNFDFLLSGVPNLVANQDDSNYLPIYHSEADVVEKINTREAKLNVAIASVLVWNLAESPQRLGKRQTRSEVDKLLVDTKLDDQMKAFGQWEEWQEGKRGVH